MPSPAAAADPGPGWLPAYLEAMPSRWWCQPAEDEIDYVGTIEPGKLTNLGAIRRGTDGSFILTANSSRAWRPWKRTLPRGTDTEVTRRSARTAENW